MDNKLWGGRFEKDTDPFAEGFHSSISFDKRMIEEDIAGSLAHAQMLGNQGIIPKEDVAAIIGGLKSVMQDVRDGKVNFSTHDEDIHMNVERLLTEKIGDAGKKLHTGRSRNDQVATDLKLFMKKETVNTIKNIRLLCDTILNISEENTETIMPAYTHLQKAQPTTLAHYLMAYFEMFLRDAYRFSDCLKRMDVLPLGAGALCATTYPLDRRFTAQKLGFRDVTRNSIDSVSDRDYALEYLSCSSICMMHLSRLSEELILFSTNEFGTIRLDDSYSTGSSIMPQKKNPDMAELIRGKTGRVYGDLIGLLTVMKGLPLAYNKDMQEDKEGVFDAIDTLNSCLIVMTGMIASVKFNKEKLAASAALGFTNATDAADYLVSLGMPFRDAHAVIGKMVIYCENEGKSLSDLTLDELKKFAPEANENFYDAVALSACVNNRKIVGGPAPETVKEHIETAKKLLSELSF